MAVFRGKFREEQGREEHAQTQDSSSVFRAGEACGQKESKESDRFAKDLKKDIHLRSDCLTWDLDIV